MGVAATKGGRVTHVKPHGAINNKAATDMDLAMALARGIAGVSKDLIFLAPAGSAMVDAARKMNLPVAQEVFADRNYDDDGNLVPRGQPKAMVHDNDEALANVLRMVQEKAIVSLSGKRIPCNVDSICVHGTGRLWRLPVCYAPDLALDLLDVAERCKTTPDAVIATHRCPAA